jgi:hypothetical protein
MPAASRPTEESAARERAWQFQLEGGRLAASRGFGGGRFAGPGAAANDDYADDSSPSDDPMNVTGRGVEKAGQAVETGGEIMEDVGKVAEKGGRLVRKGGQATARAGASLSSTGIGAIAGVPLMVIGAGGTVAGGVGEVGGKAAQKGGKVMQTGGRLGQRAGRTAQNLAPGGDGVPALGPSQTINQRPLAENFRPGGPMVAPTGKGPAQPPGRPNAMPGKPGGLPGQAASALMSGEGVGDQAAEAARGKILPLLFSAFTNPLSWLICLFYLVASWFGASFTVRLSIGEELLILLATFEWLTVFLLIGIIGAAAACLVLPSCPISALDFLKASIL